MELNLLYVRSTGWLEDIITFGGPYFFSNTNEFP